MDGSIFPASRAEASSACAEIFDPVTFPHVSLFALLRRRRALNLYSEALANHFQLVNEAPDAPAEMRQAWRAYNGAEEEVQAIERLILTSPGRSTDDALAQLTVATSVMQEVSDHVASEYMADRTEYALQGLRSALKFLAAQADMPLSYLEPGGDATGARYDAHPRVQVPANAVRLSEPGYACADGSTADLGEVTAQ